jgi:hypothetical protein
MKNGRLKTMVVSAIAGALLLSCSVVALATTGSGYQSYKDTVKTTMLTTKNATISAQFEVKDNGAIILSGNSIQKLDNANSSSKTNLIVAGITKVYEASESNGTRITRVDDQYYSASGDKESAGREERANLSESSSTVKLAEVVVDTLVGDVKNQFVQDGQTISVNLEGAQIPQLARLALSAAAENSSRMENGKQQNDENMKSIMAAVPKLTNIDVKSIAMTATVDGTTLKNNQFTIVITGQDANGASHELTITLNGDISNVGNTKIDTVDTTGKQVQAIDWAQKFHNRD